MKTKLPDIILALLLCVALQVSYAQTMVADKIVAVVGDNLIMLSDVEVQYNQAKAQSQDPIAEDFKCVLFDRLMLEKLFLAQAKIDSVTVPDEEVDAELDRRVRYFVSVFGSKEKLEEYYGKSLLELKDEFRTDIESQLISDKMRGKVLQGLKVSPAEVKEYFKNIPPDSIPYFNAELEIGQIVMYPKVNEQQKKLAREKAEKIRSDILSGSDFSLQAILYSEDPGSAADGGNLGIVERGELVPEFEAVAFKLKQGEMSEVVETPFGFHIIILDERRGDKLKARHILVKPKIVSSDIRETKETMDSVYQLLSSGQLTLREAVNIFSDDEQSKSVGGLITNNKNGTTFFEKSEIEGSLIFTIDRMKVGDFSEVLPYAAMDRTGEVKQGYRIIWLKSETKPHKASLDQDYSRIQSAARAAKQDKELAKWIDIFKEKTFIRIDEAYSGCPEVAKWKSQ